MSSIDRRSALTAAGAAVLLLGGCLRPMLAETGDAADLRGRIALPPVDDRFSYHVAQSLEDRLGAPARGDLPWQLDLRTTVQERRFAVAQDNSVTRITLAATATWTVRAAGEPDPVLEGIETTQSGYSATSSLFATREIRRDIERRLALDLAERVARAILARADALVS